jgi:FAD synthetase
MSLEALTEKYIASAEKVMKELEQTKGAVTVTEEDVNRILSYVTNYLEDAKYYKAQKNLETSLTSIAYCEGLLDALKLSGAVKFEWPTNMKRKK